MYTPWLQSFYFILHGCSPFTLYSMAAVLLLYTPWLQSFYFILHGCSPFTLYSMAAVLLLYTPWLQSFYFLRHFFHNQLAESQSPKFHKIRGSLNEIFYQIISNTTKEKMCTFHSHIIKANSKIIARTERNFLKFLHNFLRVALVCQVLVLFPSNLSHLNFLLWSK